jgi:hypothetical protein
MKRSGVRKTYLTFFTVVPLLLISSLFRIDCPVCGGSGTLASSSGMEYVRISDIQIDEKYIERNYCETYIIYKYKVVLSLNNDSDSIAHGWIKLTLKEYRKDRVMDIQYVTVEIPATTTAEYTYLVWYRTGLDEALRTEIDPEVILGVFPDDICNGTGEVAANKWLLIDILSKNLSEKSQVLHQFKPPVYYPPIDDPGQSGE